MKTYLFLIFNFLFLMSGFTQNKAVTIIEKKKGKRIILLAKNNTKDTVNIFLMVNAEGFRKSADKPILKDILPYKTVPITTLIELEGQPSSYTYDLIINEKLNNEINIVYDKEVLDIENKIKNRLVLFSIDQCDKCEVLATMLEANRINFKSFNIENDKVLYQQFMKFIGEPTEENEKIRFPVIWNKNYTLFGYDDLQEVLQEVSK